MWTCRLKHRFGFMDHVRGGRRGAMDRVRGGRRGGVRQRASRHVEAAPLADDLGASSELAYYLVSEVFLDVCLPRSPRLSRR